jgi:voltage-gated potassium channel
MNRFSSLRYKYRFELFLATLVFCLFGILFFNDVLFTTYLLPIGLLLNIVLGINLISNKKVRILFSIIFSVIFIITVFTIGSATFNLNDRSVNLVRFTLYFLFYVIITIQIIKQVWRINEVSKDLIMGVISGYISLGLVGFFIFMAIEITHPGSFDSALLTDTLTINEKADSLLYFSYITLMTIGYGEVIPVAAAAQKASILLGLLGQFYLVIITAVTVGKYINYTHKQ